MLILIVKTAFNFSVKLKASFYVIINWREIVPQGFTLVKNLSHLVLKFNLVYYYLPNIVKCQQIFK